MPEISPPIRTAVPSPRPQRIRGILLAVGLLLGATAGLAQGTHGLVASLPCDPPLADETGNSVTFFRIDAGFTTDRFGRANRALRLSSLGRYVIVDIPGLPVAGSARTLSFWMQRDGQDAGRQAGDSYLVSWGSEASGQGFGVYVAAPPAEPSLTGYLGLDDNPTERIASAAWIHVVHTYDGQSSSIYVNGTLAVEKSVALNTAAGNRVVLGGRIFGRSVEPEVRDYFSGALDEVRIWNRSLSAREVSILYLDSSRPITTDLDSPAPVITMLNAPRQVVEEGANLALDARVNGATRFQWYRNGMPIAGANLPGLNLRNLSLARDGGWYQLGASNAVGTSYSDPVFVLVSSPYYRVRGWGGNPSGAATVPLTLGTALQVAAGTAHALALLPDGRVLGWGSNANGRATPPAGLANVVALSTFSGTSLALTAEGTVVGWGVNTNGQATPPADLRDVVAIAAGANHSVALLRNRTVVAWGLNSGGQSAPPAGLSDVAAIAAGSDYSLAIRTDGAMFAWGVNSQGRATLPTPVSPPRSIGAHLENSVALLADGNLLAWGNSAGRRNQPPAGPFVAVSLGSGYGLALRPSGQVEAWGDGTAGGNLAPPDPDPVVALVAGHTFNLGIFDLRRSLSPEPAAILSQPASQVVEAGQPITLSVSASGFPQPTLQWLRGGIQIAGATKSSYVVQAAGKGDAGTYEVVVSNLIGTTTHTVRSVPAAIEVVPSSRLSNLSVRTTLAPAQVLTLGAVVAGQPKSFLIRAGGPALNAFGLQGMADPRLDLFRGTSAPSGSNDDWSPALASVFQAVGAFPYGAGSRDAALNPALTGAFTVEAKGSGPGTVLVEAYDVTGGNTGRLVNLSARNQVGTGDDILIAGFAISGRGSKQVLIRAVGPSLAGFGVSGFLSDPRLAIFSGAGTRLAENDNWGVRIGTATLATAANFSAVGAFPLNGGSRDAALLITLNAGASYTVQVAGVNNTTGEALIEVYEVF
jgi:hypothetical protein